MRKVLIILLTVGLLSDFAAGLLAPIFAIFVEGIGGGILEASGAWAIYSIVTGSAVLLIGRMEDKKIDKRNAILFGFGLETIGISLYFILSNPIQLFLIQVILGLSFALYVPAWDAIYSKSLDKGMESFEWGLQEGFTLIIEAVAAILGGVISAFFGFKMLVLFMFISSLCGFIFSIVFWIRTRNIDFFKRRY